MISDPRNFGATCRKSSMSVISLEIPCFPSLRSALTRNRPDILGLALVSPQLLIGGPELGVGVTQLQQVVLQVRDLLLGVLVLVLERPLHALNLPLGVQSRTLLFLLQLEQR